MYMDSVITVMRSTVRIPQDSRHRHIITVPVEIWEGEGLTEGDLIEVDIRKLKGVEAPRRDLGNEVKNE